MTALRSLLTRRQLLQDAAAMGAWSVLGPAAVSGQPRTAIARTRAAGASGAGGIDLVIDAACHEWTRTKSRQFIGTD
ncbi:MAG: twin-arginine translocation signal domain-containing protein [Gemmatimonadaceae bacterium]|uniref:twin-arginine translocation signal domain-containing protein n=1 Tax=Gemmatimonas sp. UBA7669 TaxID=1946568 RepID=UPI0025B98AA1|nr:twin-arginine translocation signal domain-containing protein [Gemmatimonas sp. UBA7669]MBX9854856.1 twin-arginine translocation signal domain-containing protein [Gemmatimonadaceae bacterium]